MATLIILAMRQWPDGSPYWQVGGLRLAVETREAQSQEERLAAWTKDGQKMPIFREKAVLGHLAGALRAHG